MSQLSIRLRLTLTNALVMSIILIIVAGLIVGTTKVTVERSIDHDLLRRTENARHGPPPISKGPQSDSFNRPNQQLPDQQDLGNQSDDQGPFPRDRNANRPAPPDDRPRYFTLEAKPLTSFEHDPPKSMRTFERAKQGQAVLETISTDEGRFRVSMAPVYSRGEDGRAPLEGAPIASVVQVYHRMDDMERLIASQIQVALALLPLGMGLSVAAGWFLTSSALRPIESVTNAAKRITEQDLAVRLPVHRDDEIGRLATMFNGMLSRLETSFHRQRQFTADASHELRTPIARMKLVTSATLSQESSAEELRDALVVADKAADSMSRLIQQLLVLARADSGSDKPEPARVSVLAAVENANIATQANADLKIDAGMHVLCDLDDLTRVYVNLLENAKRYCPPDKQISVVGEVVSKQAVVTVRDFGPGVDHAHLAHLGERFYRVDAARSRRDGGSGLGLAIVKTIVESHGGTISFGKHHGEGLVVRIQMPLV